MTTIRHLAASTNVSVLAAGEFEAVVHLWDVDSLSILRTFDTTLDFGGRRLAVSPDGSLVIAGAYRIHGIAAYRTSDGSEVWRRKDLKKVQQIEFTHDGNHVLCCLQDAACQSLNASTGKSGTPIRGIKNLWTSQHAPVRLMQRSRDLLIADDHSCIAAIPKCSFGTLSAAFSPSQVCVSEAGGPVRLFDLSTGKMLWRHDPPEDTHFLSLAYASALNRFVGVSWPFQHGGQYLLQHFDSGTGETNTVTETPMSYECVFYRSGSQLITASGAVLDVASGRLMATLPFPIKNAANR